MTTVNIIGLGYIGLPTAALLANSGFRVFGTDVNEEAVKTINAGRIHIVEPGLDLFVEKAVSDGMLTAHMDPVVADIYMICVPTPFKGQRTELPTPDLSFVLEAAKSISSLLRDGNIVILESTSPVGTTDLVGRVFSDAGVCLEVLHIAYCPERVLPGKIMEELIANDRIVGGLNKDATEATANFYRQFVKGNVVETDARTAEMCKLTENSFRDVNIAFANEISMLCDSAGVDVWELINLTNLHPRVDVLQPGTGVGGHCIAVDPWFLASIDPGSSKLIQTARNVNLSKTRWVVEQIRQIADALRTNCQKGVRIACLGLAFKPDIDDLRESPAMRVVSELQSDDLDVMAVEPNIEHSHLVNLVSLDFAIETADLIVILVKHREFLSTDAQTKLQTIATIDFCGALSQHCSA